MRIRIFVNFTSARCRHQATFSFNLLPACRLNVIYFALQSTILLPGNNLYVYNKSNDNNNLKYLFEVCPGTELTFIFEFIFVPNHYWKCIAVRGAGRYLKGRARIPKGTFIGDRALFNFPPEWRPSEFISFW